uniref:CSD domain-containing protein n=1 Tax=Poecilia latipinna TaxID=48699 RepID=A0A3B3TRY0_9TELE
MSFDPGMLHNNGHTAYANGSGPGIRETGVVEKLLTSYGFIQCSERQARLFFHCSQYNGNLQELKIGGEIPATLWRKPISAACIRDLVLSVMTQSS